MTKPPETRIGPSEAATRHGGRLLPPARYRHPGDVIRLIVAGPVAGLTGVGMQSRPAVSAVLPYRLATYWLPVPPGWLAWRTLVRREHA